MRTPDRRVLRWTAAASALVLLILLPACSDAFPVRPDAPVAAEAELVSGAPAEPPVPPPRRDGFAEELIPVLEPLPNPGGPGDAFGGAVAALDDVDGDGVTDLAVASPRADRVHLFSGATRARLYGIGDPDGESGFFFGNAVAAVGDVDGDGVDDLAVGAMADPGRPPLPDDGCIPGPNRDCPDDAPPNPTTGRAFLFSGAAGAFIRHLRPDRRAFTFGMRVAGPGDVDGDGVPDVVVSAPFAPGGAPGFGQVFAISGADGQEIWFRRDPPRCVGFETPICGLDFASFGMGLAAAPDLDGDAVQDVLVGDPSNSSFLDSDPDFRDRRQGARVSVLSGATGAVLRIHEDPDEETGYGGAVGVTGSAAGGGSGDYVAGIPVPGALDLFDGASGARRRRVVSPGDPSTDRFSSTLAPGDDYDDDGRTDFWVGAAGSGTVYLINPFGRVLLSVSGLGTGVPVPLTFTLQLAPTGNLGFDARRDLLLGDGAEDAAYVLRVETPRSLLQEEIARIAALAAQGVLNPGRANSLDSKVRVSLRGAEKGNPRQASRPLGALVNEVTAYERADVLSAEQARSLIDPADRVREWIRESL